MHQIALYQPGNGSTGEVPIANNEFSQRVLAICDEHQRSRRAVAFAIILNRVEDPEISKALHDAVYWNALDAISANHLTVFVCYSPVNSSANFTIEQLTNASLARKELACLFGERDLELPSIIFFQVKDHEVIDMLCVPVRTSSVDEAWKKIKETVTLATKSVSRVTDENRENSPEIFALIKDAFVIQRENAIVLALFKLLSKITNTLG